MRHVYTEHYTCDTQKSTYNTAYTQKNSTKYVLNLNSTKYWMAKVKNILYKKTLRHKTRPSNYAGAF